VRGPAIEFDGVGLTLGNTEILRDVSFKVRAGTIHCIVGANGGGKTSLVRSLLGQMPHSGRIGIQWALVIAGPRQVVEPREVDLAGEAGARGEVHEVAGLGAGALVVRPEERGALPAMRDHEQRLLEIRRGQHPRQQPGLARAGVGDRHVDEHRLVSRIRGLARHEIDAELGARGGGLIRRLRWVVRRRCGAGIVGVTGRTCLEQASEEHERDAAG
jgi:energy-coupling factor transporter ATP-binding protein EcfA2